MDKRDDKGMLFENMFIMEQVKNNTVETFPPEMYFWRTRDKLEIDVVMVKDTNIKAFECKWSEQKVSFTKFKELYPSAETSTVTPDYLINDTGRKNVK
jgi:predicted AAA+ superfamily ATPase